MSKNDYIKYIHIKRGDITFETTDAIVNAANTSLLGGGGVDGAIHHAAGPELLDECRKLGGCNPGEARITRGYKLKSKYIIHTPGPVYIDGKNNEAKILYNSYWNSMLLVKKNNIKSVSFPAISTGVYRYPRKDAAEIAIKTVMKFMENEEYPVDVSFIVYDNDNYKIYINTLEEIKNELY